MTKLILNAELLARLGALEDLVELCDESGQTLGYFHPVVHRIGGKIAEPECPFSDEELERRRQQRSGRPLKEILKDLEGE